MANQEPSGEDFPGELLAMDRIALATLACLSLLLPSCVTAAERPKPQAAGAFQKIHSVTEVNVRTLESFPEQLQIEALGRTRSAGWTGERLRPAARVDKDGLLNLEFVAAPPRDPAAQALTPIQTTLTMRKPADYKGVRVIAETNAKTAR